MTNAALSLPAHAGYLDNHEIHRLIALVQTDYPQDVTDADGTERTVYRTTPESEDALVRLHNAFLPLLHKAARGSSVLEYDDALMIAVEEFISTVRRYELDSALPFTAGLSTILIRKLGDVGRTSGLIVVKENAAARYRQLMDSVDWDLNAAYDLVVSGYRDGTGTHKGFTPDTFLSVHRAVGVESLDVSASEAMGSSNTSAGISDQSKYRNYIADPTPSPEDLTVQAELVRWLFTLIASRQEQILRLRYGFCDLATENIRLRHGYRTGEILSDRQVAQVVGSTTPTVNRQRSEALTAMRDALEEVEAA